MKATKKCQFCGKPFVTRSGMQRYCRGLSGGSQASQNGTEEQPLQSRPTTHGDTASGVSHLFQSCHAHGLFPAVRL